MAPFYTKTASYYQVKILVRYVTRILISLFAGQKQVTLVKVIKAMKKREILFKTSLWEAFKLLRVCSTTSIIYHDIDFLG